MAHGLEVRSPFLDPELLAFTSRLRPSLKARRLSLKRVLRAAVGDLLPAEIMNRPKRGFGVPLDRWFREDLRTYLGATLGAPDARVKQQLAPAALDRLLAEHDSGARNHGHAIWTLLTLEVFLRRGGARSPSLARPLWPFAQIAEQNLGKMAGGAAQNPCKSSRWS